MDMNATCVLEKTGTKVMQIFTKNWEKYLTLNTYFNANVCLFFAFTYFVTILGGECLHPGLWGWSDGRPCLSCALWKFSGYFYTGQASIDMDIRMDIHVTSMDMFIDMDGKCHIHGKPGICDRDGTGSPGHGSSGHWVSNLRPGRVGPVGSLVRA